MQRRARLASGYGPLDGDGEKLRADAGEPDAEAVEGRARRVARAAVRALPIVNSVLAFVTFTLILVFFIAYGRPTGATIERVGALTDEAATYVRSDAFRAKAIKLNATVDRTLDAVDAFTEPEYVRSVSASTLDLLTTAVKLAEKLDPNQLRELLDAIIAIFKAVAPEEGAGAAPGIRISTVIGRGNP